MTFFYKRFVGEDQEIYFGQPIDPSSSSEGSGVIGKDEQASNELKANVIDGDVFDETAKITDKVMTLLRGKEKKRISFSKEIDRILENNSSNNLQ
ncbi:20582_t:CDS:2 [Entrophospora sp. SA101]|nr:20582_t:CDS:2 [Entrophospora sp. SA101]